MTVYFIKPIGMQGPVKIGKSSLVERRRHDLETWSPFPLEILATIDGDVHWEWRFHAKFLAQHWHREWFHWSPELEATIAAINAGTFDRETLPPPVQLCKVLKRVVRSRIMNPTRNPLPTRGTAGGSVHSRAPGLLGGW